MGLLPVKPAELLLSYAGPDKGELTIPHRSFPSLCEVNCNATDDWISQTCRNMPTYAEGGPQKVNIETDQCLCASAASYGSRLLILAISMRSIRDLADCSDYANVEAVVTATDQAMSMVLMTLVQLPDRLLVWSHRWMCPRENS